MDVFQLTIKKIRQKLLNKEFSAEELVKAYLKRVKREDKKYHAFLTLSEDLALQQARKIDQKISRSEEIGDLAGVPIAIKDNILVKGIKCTAGSKILENFVAPYDATVIERLKKADAVIIGKTNLDEFAMGSSTENSAFGPTYNPFDLKRVPGGSSGGSAAAVASCLSVAALGSDTGGSIRQPASFCGVVGLKPTYGAVSRYGLIAMASSLDQIGPIARTVEDVFEVFKIIAGRDSLDSTSREVSGSMSSMPDLQGLEKDILRKKIRIGLPREFFIKELDSEVKDLINKTVHWLEKTGFTIEEVSLPHINYSIPAYYIIVPAEVSANLARYDGIKYGLSEIEHSKSLEEVYLTTRSKFLGPEVKRRIILGVFVLSAGYYDAYYLRAVKTRNLIRKDFNEVFQQVDFLITPTSPHPAFQLGEKIADPLSMYLEDIFTIPVNLADLPALSVPCGQIKGLPVGLQIIGKPFKENSLFQLAYFYEHSYH